MQVCLAYPAGGEKQELPEPVLVHNSGHVDDGIHTTVLDWYREEDAEDLRRSELNESVEGRTCLNALEEKRKESWKSAQSWKREKSNQNIVMSEALVNKSAMNEEFEKNNLISANIDPNVVTDLSVFKTGGWNSLQPKTQYMERHSASSDQHMKKLMSLREGLHVMMQCYMRQHFADRYWLHEHPGGCRVENPR